MSLTDPIADMLNRIRNACAAKFDVAEIPYSKMKGEIARILKRDGFVRDFSVEGEGAAKALRLVLKYSRDRQPTIRGLRRISKPGHRQYVGTAKIPRVLDGMGIAILSTPAGIVTDNEARQQHKGGEVLCHIW
jgi:small subunit ribosomal protein S8